MGVIQLNVHPRATTGKNANRRTRAGGRIPAVIYGVRRQPTTCEVDAAEFAKAIVGHGGRGAVFALNEAGAAQPTIALLREMQRHPVADWIYHIDLFEIPADRPITVEVPIELRGESKSVRNGDATVMRLMHAVEVSCLPAELPDVVLVELTGLKMGDKVHVSDLQVERGEIVSAPEELVLQLQSTALFAEAEKPAAEAAAGEEAAAEAGEKPEKGEPADKGKADKSDKDKRK